MAAPQIPNLLSRRRGGDDAVPRGGLRSRGGPRARGSHAQSHDQTVQATDDDASDFRLSAVTAGYLDDPFAAELSGKPAAAARRLTPFLNRGTYVRTTAIDALVKDFLETWRGRDVQVVSLGAGTDTRYWRLVEELGGAFTLRCKWIELDYGDGSRRKIEAMLKPSKANATLQKAVHHYVTHVAQPADGDRTPTQGSLDSSLEQLSASEDGRSLSSPVYALKNVDLKALASENPPDLADICGDKPTLLLSECCLSYIPSEVTISIIRYFLTSRLQKGVPAQAILYEPLHPDDAFGKRMTLNLADREISMPGLEACPTLGKHYARLKEAGFHTADGVEVRDWWRTRVSQEEKVRLRRLQMVDEEEEWELMAHHYGFIWASRDS